MRTPSCAVVSSMRSRAADTRIDCPARDSPRPMTTASTTNITSRNTVDDVPDELPEKNSDTRTIAPNSPTEHAASASCPNSLSVSPASRRTGTTSPSDVDARAIATNSGDDVSLIAPVSSPKTSASASDRA
jgi:hypothetical protein